MESAPNTIGSPSAILIECELKCNVTADFTVDGVVRSETHESETKLLYRVYAGTRRVAVRPRDYKIDINSAKYKIRKVPGSIEQEEGW